MEKQKQTLCFWVVLTELSAPDGRDGALAWRRKLSPSLVGKEMMRGQVKAKPQEAAWEKSGWSLALCDSLPALGSKVLPEHLGQQQGARIYTNLLVCLTSKIRIEMKA